MSKSLFIHRFAYPAGAAFFLVLICLIFLIFTERTYSGMGIIDTHEHIQNLQKAEELRKAMSSLGIDKTILLPSPIETLTLNGSQSFTHHEENMDEILRISGIYPESFIPFCTVSPMDSNALEMLQNCHKRGGKGLKLYNGHSYYYAIFKTPLDSPRMKPIYAYAERNHLPILFHVNISQYGNELENVLRQFPDMVVSIPHFMVSSIKLERVADILDQYPNTYTDISFGNDPYLAAGFRRISRDPQKYIDFFNRYSSRILWGADLVLNDTARKDQAYMETSLQCYRSILERKTFTCAPVNDYYKGQMEQNRKVAENCQPQEGNFCKTKTTKLNSFTKWYEETKILHGLHLKANVLKKIYAENPERFLGANRE